MSYEINACKATLNHLKKTGYYDYNNANNLCYETCHNWFGSDSNVRGTECHKNCNACVVPFIKERGHDTCYFNPRPPPVFTHPAYFKDMYLKTGNKNISLKMCKDKCQEYANNIEECKQRCEIDADALIESHSIEKYSKSDNDMNNEAEEYSTREQSTFNDYAKAHPTAFYITFSVISVILAIFLVIFLWVLFTN